MTVDLSNYDNRGYRPGRSLVVRLLWYVCNAVLFASWLLPMSGPKRRLPRLFGARIGAGVVIKPRVNLARNSIVMVGSVLRGETPPDGIYAGNPATRVREREIAG
jgi:putative colanic acid biosynthesis acetyltransferase WcaF